MAKRIAAGVTALAGVRDPIKFVGDVRALLPASAQGEFEDPRDDPRITSLLARCLPPKQSIPDDEE